MTIARNFDYKRRVNKVAGLISILLLQGAHVWLKKKQAKVIKKTSRRGNFVRDRKSLITEIDLLPDYIFKQMFRMNRAVFQSVLDKINTVLRDRDDDVMAIRNVKGKMGQSLGNKTKLYATLRFLAGGSPWDICLAYRIGFGSFYAKSDRGVIWPIMRAINKTYNISLDVSDTTKLDQMAK
jgi:hypothetical protein